MKSWLGTPVRTSRRIDPTRAPTRKVVVDLGEDAINRRSAPTLPTDPWHERGFSVECEQSVLDARRATVDREHEAGLIHAPSFRALVAENDLQRALSRGVFEGVVCLHDVVEREAVGDQLSRR